MILHIEDDLTMAKRLYLLTIFDHLSSLFYFGELLNLNFYGTVFDIYTDLTYVPTCHL